MNHNNIASNRKMDLPVFSGLDKRPSENGDEWIEGYILQVEFCLLRLSLFDREANTVNAKAFGFVRNAVYRLLICLFI
jgi:hypothetical protein